MLEVIPKKITTHKGPNMIERLATGVQRRIVMFAPVRHIGAEKKQLKRTQYGRDHPEKDKIFPREDELEQVIRNGHKQNLLPRNIGCEK
jgi:hypothetical protein